MTQEFWYLSRAAGFTAYLLLAVSLALGIAVGTRFADRIAKRNTIFDLHRFTTILALAFTLFHVYILLLDGFFNFNIWQLSIPFLSPYRSWQTAIGVTSMYTLIVLVSSFYLRRFIGYRAWRAIHFLTFALFAGVTLHGISAGTDTSQPWAKLIYLGAGAVTFALIMYRIQHHIPASSAVRTARLASGIAAVTVALLLLLSTELLEGGEESEATTSVVATQTAAAVGTPAARTFLDTFNDDMTGTFTQTRDTSNSLLIINSSLQGDVAAKLHVELAQTSAPGQQQATITKNVVELRDETTDAMLCTGTLTALQNAVLRASCAGSGPYAGFQITIASRLQAGDDGSIAGTIAGAMKRTN